MKKSELKKMIKEGVEEALTEMLPDLVEMIKEGVETSSSTSISQEPSLVESTRNEDQLSLIRQKFRQANPESNSSYTGLPKPPKPDNPKAVVNGETFASGKGILEWFTNSKVANNKAKDAAHENKMKDFMEKKFGVK